MFVFEDGVQNDGLTQGIGRNEVRVTLSRMKKGETTEIDGIPDYAKIWTMQASSGHRVLPHDAYRVSHCCNSFSTLNYVLLKMHLVPGMCPEPRWIDYTSPRSAADSFAMAGPIRHCLLRAWQSTIMF